jgi:glycosyltransferase involved in cell wall biosynthesis
MRHGAGPPLRVTHLVNSLEPGGLERVVVDLVRGMRARHVVGDIVCTDGAPGAMGARLGPEITVRCLGSRPGLDVVAVVRLARMLRGVDLVHSHNQRPHLLGTLAARLGRVPLTVNTRHGLHTPWRTRRDTLRRRGLAALTAAIVAVSDAVRKVAVDVDGIAPERVHTIPNGTDVTRRLRARAEARQELALPADAFVVGAMGRLSPEKDHRLFVEALAHVRRARPDVHGVIIGDGPLAGELRRLIGAHDLERAVTLTGYRAEAPSLLRALDMFVQPSRTEGTSLALLEAMAAGLGVVVTDVGGNREVAGEGAGLLTAPGDVAALAAAITHLAGNPEVRIALGTTARRRVVERYSLETMAAAYEHLYEDLARGSERR